MSPVPSLILCCAASSLEVNASLSRPRATRLSLTRANSCCLDTVFRSATATFSVKATICSSVVSFKATNVLSTSTFAASNSLRWASWLSALFEAESSNSLFSVFNCATSSPSSWTLSWALSSFNSSCKECGLERNLSISLSFWASSRTNASAFSMRISNLIWSFSCSCFVCKVLFANCNFLICSCRDFIDSECSLFKSLSSIRWATSALNLTVLGSLDGK